LASTITTQAIAQQNAEPILIQANQLEIYPDKMEQFRAIHRDSFIPASRARDSFCAIFPESKPIVTQTPEARFPSALSFATIPTWSELAFPAELPCYEADHLQSLIA
jgi:hypothetical protein